MKHFSIMFLISILSLFVGCETSVIDSNPRPSNDVFTIPFESLNSLIVNGQWKIKQFKMNGEVTSLDDCVMDNIINFNEGGSFDYAFNTKCDAEENDFTGYWEVIKRSNKVFLKTTGTASDSNEITEYEIKSISQSEAVLIEQVDQLGRTYTFETTYAQAVN